MTQDFWSRRKAKVAAETEAETEVTVAEPEMTDAEVLAAFDLPDPDTLIAGDDIKGFMAKAVPDHLRRRALRRLWRLNPVLANVDGLVDYGEDFTDSAKVVDHMQTAYQVGKGMLTHLEKLAAPPEVMAEDEDEEPEEAPIQIDATVTAYAEIETELDEAPAPRRRMRFEYQQEVAS
ncbi:DUF3306 domain-containing protein [Yoonia maritima]|uniref:DUF3306 domain-containing protein n=1 Tax=Yoonia maritima TaxID=1435347 RepID=UPI000D0FF775|nr:DUF3306 domain-containing protein [Yoonia maritima]